MAERVVRINGIDVPIADEEVTGAELKAAAGVPARRVLVRQDTDRNVIVPDEVRVRVAPGDSFSHHARHSKAQP